MHRRELVARLRTAFVGAASQPWFAPLGDLLLLDGFTAAEEAQYAPLLDWDREAKAAGYPAAGLSGARDPARRVPQHIVRAKKESPRDVEITRVDESGVLAMRRGRMSR